MPPCRCGHVRSAPVPSPAPTPGSTACYGPIPAVKGAGTGQRVAAILLPLAVLTGQILFADQQRRYTVCLQYIRIGEVLVAQNRAIDPLCKQRVNAVFDTVGIAVIGKAGS